MLTPRFVVDYVANRYGKLKPILAKEAEKLGLVKDGTLNVTDLESDRERVKLRMARESASPEVALERINGVSNFQDKYVVDKLSAMAKSVCRILKNGSPYGTGFLVGEDIILTNNHVIPSAGDANNMIAEFDYELSPDQLPKKSSCFKINAQQFFLTSSLNNDAAVQYSGLDFTLIGIDKTGIYGESLGNYPPVYIDGNKGKIIKGESCVIIQHPNGLPKKIVLRDIAFFYETTTRLVYESDTLPGSSGSMVVGLGTCEIVALHHSGLPKTNDKNQILTKDGAIADDSTPDDQIDWIGNEGIKISKIVEALANSSLPVSMETTRQALLQKTAKVSEKLDQAMSTEQPPAPTPSPIIVPTTGDHQTQNITIMPPTSSTATVDFLITMVNKSDAIQRVESILKVRYGQIVKLRLAMPASAEEGKIELFTFSVSFTGNVNDEAQNLIKVPGILNAEADVPLALNADMQFEPPASIPATESGFLVDDGLGVWDEDEFLKDYEKSPYVNKNKLDQCRMWNWLATNFDKVGANPNAKSPAAAGIRIVQFDTGYTDHSKVVNGYDLDQDYNFLDNSDNAMDPRTVALGKQPGHGTRTGSLLIGKKSSMDPTADHNGNEGLLFPFDYKLVPFRIAETVVIINRQQQLASALDRAIAQGFDVITMSMGLPPTIATAKMAKKAYDKGIIWCCAAGNEVQAVVAPAVYPGTIAVAASNPLDYDWKGSSRGDAVDITAPGEDVYVPIWNKDKKEDYAYGNGTSYATPHVAAAAALWLAAYQNDLNKPEYGGWKRVEAFRNALDRSARRKNNLPTQGFGHGILDIDQLLKTKPLAANKLEYAYNNWNENAFFATLQGYGELVKTYWNKIHGWFSKSKRGGQEAMIPVTESLSSDSENLERALFKTTLSQFESAQPAGQEQLLSRYNMLQNIIEQSHK